MSQRNSLVSLIPAWGIALLIGFLVPQVAFATVPRPSFPIKKPTQWLNGSQRHEVSLPAGLLIESQLRLTQHSQKGRKVLLALNSIRDYDQEILKLRHERDKRYGLIWPIVATAIGGSLIVGGLLATFDAVATSLEVAFLVSSIFFIVPGIIFLIIGLTKLIKNSKKRKIYNRRIRILVDERARLMQGGGKAPVREEKPLPPPQGDPDASPPPGGDSLVAPTVSLLEFSF